MSSLYEVEITYFTGSEVVTKTLYCSSLSVMHFNMESVCIDLAITKADGVVEKHLFSTVYTVITKPISEETLQ